MAFRCIFLPGAWMCPKYQNRLANSLKRKNIECVVVWGPQEDNIRSIIKNERDIIIGHSFGAFRAMNEYPYVLNRRILWNPVGIYPWVGRCGYLLGIIFKFKIIGILGRLWGIEWMKHERTLITEKAVAKNITITPLYSYWNNTYHLRFSSVPTHIIYSQNDRITSPQYKIADTIIPDANHLIREKDWVHVIDDIIKNDRFTTKKIDYKHKVTFFWDV